jgi:hypothetical protein
VIDFRYHIVSLVAVFLALALGLFLGSTTLQSTVTHSLRQQANHVTAENQVLETEHDQLTAELSAARAFDNAVLPYGVGDRLAGLSVAVVSAPGVSSSVRTAMISAIGTAGATVTADVRLQSGYLDPTQDAQLGQLAAQLAQGRPLPAANGATQAGAELARALVSRPGASVPSAHRIELILTTLSAGKMISVSGALPVHPADLALLLVPLGAAPDSTAVAIQQNADLVGLVRQLRDGSSGVVVAAPTAQDGQNAGALAAIRQNGTVSRLVSTVDGDDTAVGQIAAVLALAAAPGGTVGRFGPDETPPLPTSSSAP